MDNLEKNLIEVLEPEYFKIIDHYLGTMALHIATIPIKDEKTKLISKLNRIAQTSEIGLGLSEKYILPTKAELFNKIVVNKNDKIEIDEKYLVEGEGFKLKEVVRAINAIVFMNHVHWVVNNENPEAVKASKLFGWYDEVKNPIDFRENPRLYLKQKHVQCAMAYAIYYTENAIKVGDEAIAKLTNK